MSVIAATIRDIHLVEGANSSISHATTGERKTYRAVLSLGTQTAGDTFAVVTADDKIEAFLKNGKTVTLRQAAGGPPGLTPGGTAAYAIVDVTISGTTLSGSVGGPTAAAAVAAGTTVSVFVTVDES